MPWHIFPIACVVIGLVTVKVYAQPVGMISGVMVEDQLFVAYPNKDVAKYGGELLRGSIGVKG